MPGHYARAELASRGAVALPEVDWQPPPRGSGSKLRTLETHSRLAPTHAGTVRSLQGSVDNFRPRAHARGDRTRALGAPRRGLAFQEWRTRLLTSLRWGSQAGKEP